MAIAQSSKIDKRSAANRMASSSSSSQHIKTTKEPVKNIVVIGASYAGTHAAELLAAGLPKTHRVILIDKNSHFNHVYRFVRFGVVPGHEAKGFVPYTNVLTKHLPESERDELSRPSTSLGMQSSSEYASSSENESATPALIRDMFIHASVTDISPEWVEVDRALCTNDGLTKHCLVDPFEVVHPHAYAEGKGRPISRRVLSQGLPLRRSANACLTEESDCDPYAVASAARQILARRGSLASLSTSPRTNGNAQSGAASPMYSTRNTSAESLISDLGNASAVGPTGQDEQELQAAFDSLWTYDQEDVHGLEEQYGRKVTRIRYDYLVFATGSLMPRPLLIEGKTKREGVHFLRAQQDVISRASSILIVGGGALGIQYATDIADLYNGPQSDAYRRKALRRIQHRNHRSGEYPEVIERDHRKKITLIHSRDRLLPVFEPAVSAAALRRLEELGVDVILGDRLILPPGEIDPNEGKVLTHRILKTQKGRTLESDLQLFCTGQKPNTKLQRQLVPDALADDGYINVKRSMQVDLPVSEDGTTALQHERQRLSRNVFAVGDCCHAFGAIKAGHTGWFQAAVAARNILTLVKHDVKRAKRLRVLQATQGVSAHGSKLLSRRVNGDSDSASSSEDAADDDSDGLSTADEGSGSGSSAHGKAPRHSSHHPTQTPDTLAASAEVIAKLLPDPSLEEYKPGPPMLSLSVGLGDSIKQLVGRDGQLEVSEHRDEAVDSHWEAQWRILGMRADDPFI